MLHECVALQEPASFSFWILQVKELWRPCNGNSSKVIDFALFL